MFSTFARFMPCLSLLISSCTLLLYHYSRVAVEDFNDAVTIGLVQYILEVTHTAYISLPPLTLLVCELY